MKKILLSLMLCGSTITMLFGQTVPIPNGTFESWLTTGSFEHPVFPDAPFASSNHEYFYTDTVINVYETDGSTGSGITVENMLNSKGDTLGAWASIGIVGDDFGPGAPLNGVDMITGVSFDVRYDLDASSTGLFLALPMTGGAPSGPGMLPDPAGVYVTFVSGSQSTYTTVTLNFFPALTQAPDEIVIAWAAGDPFNQYFVPGDYIDVDNVTLLGTTQTIDGADFEDWEETGAIEYPEYWIPEEFSALDTTVLKSEDSYEGDYSLLLCNTDDGSGDVDEVGGVNLGQIEWDTTGSISEHTPAIVLPSGPNSVGVRYKRTSSGADTARMSLTFTHYYSPQDSFAVVGYDEIVFPPGSDWEYATSVIAGFSDTPEYVFIRIENGDNYMGTPMLDSKLWVDDVRFHYCDDSAEVDGPNLLCTGQTSVDYTVTDEFASGYLWSAPFGSINSGTTSQTVNVDVTASSDDSVWVTKSYIDGCPDAEFYLPLTIGATAVAQAGPDETVCSNEDVWLEGNVGGTTTGTWTSSGSGSFDDANSLDATYSPSGTDLAAGSVTLTLTTVGGSCGTANDDVVITFTAEPTADAGADQVICEGSTVSLVGNNTNSTGLMWSGGDGSFSPNTVTASVTYTPSANDIDDGEVELYLTTTGNGVCEAAEDTVLITIDGMPTADAGVDHSICAGTTSMQSGTHANSTGVVWSTSGSGTFDNNTLTNTTYTPSGADESAGTVTLTMTTTGNGVCSAVTDDVVITITPLPTASAGSDQTICSNADASLSGSSTNSVSIQWSGGTGTYAPDNMTATADYTPSAGEITAGSVTLTITATSATCGMASDDVVITIEDAPTVDAGTNQSGCGGLTLSGTVGGSATGGVWSSDGTGTFSPSTTDLNATYTASAADVSTGTVNITLTTSGSTACTAVSDVTVLTVSAGPTADAGTDFISCISSTFSLSGSITVSTTATWTSSGTGTFDDANSLNANYTPSAADESAGTVTLTLTTTDNGACSAAVDDVVVTLSACPAVDPALSTALIVSPNPTLGVVNVTLDEAVGEINISIVNELQQVVASGSGPASGTTLDLSHLASGVYVLIVESDEGVAIKRIIKN